jgi:hypothetical protein
LNGISFLNFCFVSQSSRSQHDNVELQVISDKYTLLAEKLPIQIVAASGTADFWSVVVFCEVAEQFI